MADLNNIMEELSKLTLMEASELVTALEEKWGVKASSGGGMMMMAGGAAAGGDAAEEKTEFDVELTSIGGKKIQVIKAVREITGLGLKDAKELVDGAPKVIKEAVSKEDADGMKAKLEEQGATCTLK